MQPSRRPLCRFAAVYRELRVYTVRPGAMEAWVAEWREHVYPLRLQLGFSIPAAWVVEGGDRFVWLLEYDGDDYESANAAYYESPERQALDPDPARHLTATEHWPLRPVL
jgi:NIPSNAP